MSKLIIKNGHLLDPLNQIDEVCDLCIEEGVIAEITPSLTIPKSAEVLDVKGACVAPGFVDLHVHFREPGQEYKETIATGSRAAAAGGFTSVCCMANTSPVNDHGAITEFILKKAKEEACVHVFPIGSVTKNLEGKELSEIGELKSAGCVALSDDGKTIENNALLRHAMEYAKGFELPLISHALCHDLMGKGVMNEGPVATELGLKGIPHEAEEIIIARDIALSALTDHPIHIAHVSTARGVELVREAKKRRLKVSC
ncbi:MAG: dihydroorotase, partial [Deltaproteobacteria bacterium]|nr:dihydroorotase [Deltaproteobacteria bacterium]